MIVLRTEIWATPSGPVAKAVARDEAGRIVGASNQTASISIGIVGRK